MTRRWALFMGGKACDRRACLDWYKERDTDYWSGLDPCHQSDTLSPSKNILIYLRIGISWQKTMCIARDHQKLGNYICLLLYPLSIYYYFFFFFLYIFFLLVINHFAGSQESKYKPIWALGETSPKEVMPRLKKEDLINFYMILKRNSIFSQKVGNPKK